MIVVIDDQDRENEGDLMLAAEMNWWGQTVMRMA
jgi:3,4-dihydroxy-2-butanone 4-phosphate synthase